MSELLVTIDLQAAEPPYEQVRDQFADLIASGALAEGDKLPTVRGLATDLQLAPGTVARAYKELEAQGLITTRSRAGTVVAARAQSAEVALRHLADALAERAVDAGLDEASVLAIVRAALAEARG